jgi:hypothetical protein
MRKLGLRRLLVQLAAVALTVVALVGWWVLGASLRPVVRMTRQVAA